MFASPSSQEQQKIVYFITVTAVWVFLDPSNTPLFITAAVAASSPEVSRLNTNTHNFLPAVCCNHTHRYEYGCTPVAGSAIILQPQKPHPTCKPAHSPAHTPNTRYCCLYRVVRYPCHVLRSTDYRYGSTIILLSLVTPTNVHHRTFSGKVPGPRGNFSK